MTSKTLIFFLGMYCAAFTWFAASFMIADDALAQSPMITTLHVRHANPAPEQVVFDFR